MQTVEQFFTQEAVMSDSIHSPSTYTTNDYSQQEVKGIAPAELISLELKKLFQDFNLIMEDSSWKHFEFQSKNEGPCRFKTISYL